MKYTYEIGATRWYRPVGDPRSLRPPKGWEAFSYVLDYHPVSGRKLAKASWWTKETYTGVSHE